MSRFTSASILLNTATGRFHPIMFRAAPCNSRPERQKSAGHHTAGFDTEAEAIAFVRSEGLEPEAVYEWDGKDIPAMVI